MPSLLRDLTRRRHKSTPAVDPADDFSSASSSTNDDGPVVDSSSNSAGHPTPSRSATLSGTNLSRWSRAALSSNGKSRESLPLSDGSRQHLPLNRSSMISHGSQTGDTVSPTVAPRQSATTPTPAATSPFAPRVLSLSDGSWVHQKILLLFGNCADPQHPIDGTVTLSHPPHDHFPPVQWPVCDSHFKALVCLQPGPNRIRLDFVSLKFAPLPDGQPPVHSSWFHIHYLPLLTAPPLHLCLLVAHDSPENYDAVPDRIAREGHSLALAVKKFRMAAYLWQAFTAEHMNRNGFGRRCFRYDEEWMPGTLSSRDVAAGTMRNEARVHVVRLNHSVREIQDVDFAQQHGPAQNKNRLFDIAMDAVRAYFAPRPGQRQYVSCMFLDSHWDRQVGTVRAHAALGGTFSPSELSPLVSLFFVLTLMTGGDDTIKLAIFGSHCLQSYPAHIEEVAPALSDCTRTDTAHVANDCNEAGSSWEAANIGIGAHLHETGHLFGSPHQESGIMLRDYVRFNRTFLCREPYCTRTKQPGLRLCLPRDECAWHRLDTLRFRHHPCFQLPADPSHVADPSVQVWPVENGNVLVVAAAGVAWIELFPEGDDVCHHWIEYVDSNAPGTAGPRQVTLTEKSLRPHLPDGKHKKPLRLEIFSSAGASRSVPDFAALVATKPRIIRLPDGRPGFRSAPLGASPRPPTSPAADLPLAACRNPPLLLRAVRVWHGRAVDGIEFVYMDGHCDLLGRRGGSPAADFPLNSKRAETILGFHVRAGAWIDAVQILTSMGRKSEVFGNPTGGSACVFPFPSLSRRSLFGLFPVPSLLSPTNPDPPNRHTLIPPRGYSVAGVFGSHAAWLDTFGLIITR